MAALYWSRRSRRMIICRVLACTLTITVLCLLFFPSTVSSHPLFKKDEDSSTAEGHESNAPAYAYREPQVRLDTQHAADTNNDKHVETHYERPSSPTTSASLSDDQEDEKLEKTLRRMQQLLPDEVRMNGLLTPLIESGEVLLRDLAFRVRAYREALSTWEALHLVKFHGTMVQRDVIQRLRAIRNPTIQYADAVHIYDEARAFMNRLSVILFPWTMAYFADHMSLHASLYGGGRGIVLTAGDDQAPYLLTTIPSFRKLGCDLPIEVLYLGDEDLSEDWREELEALPGVVTRNLATMVEDSGWQLKGWAAKPFAILLSSFREVIFIDADALFFTSPTTLFSDPLYQKTGALFFKDRNLLPESKKKWLRSILPNPISEHVRQNRMWTGESGHMQDSGVVVIDTWKHFVPMLLTTRMNGPDRDGDKEIGKKGVYEMVYGDKETFWLSWELAGDLGYAFHESQAGSMGKLNATESTEETEEEPATETICSPQLLHFDSEGSPFWFNGWLAASKDDKFDDFDIQNFDYYMREPKEKGRAVTTSPWDIHPGNVVCLKAEEHFEFTEHEKEVLDMIIKIAKSKYTGRRKGHRS